LDLGVLGLEEVLLEEVEVKVCLEEQKEAALGGGSSERNA